MYTIDVCKPSVAWVLNCAAAQICQTAGFHRKDQVQRDPKTADTKISLFWYIYTSDKALALRLGRAPSIQDWDIDVPREYRFQGAMGDETTAVANMWLKLGTLQGKLYEQLSVFQLIPLSHMRSE